MSASLSPILLPVERSHPDDDLHTKSQRSAKPRGNSSYPRRRAVAACQVCRARRTKCDNKKPSCSFCLKTGAKCVTTSVDFSSFDPASLEIIQRLENLEQLLKGSDNGNHSQVDDRNIGRQEPAGLDLLPITVEGVLSWKMFDSYFSARPHLISLLQSPSPASTVSIPSIDSSTAIGELEPNSCNELLNRFFRYVHVKNPVLDEARIRRMVHRVCLEGVGWDSESCLALLVCALGSIATPFVNESANALFTPGVVAVAESYFKAAQRRLGPMLGKNRVLEAQCLFFSGVYLMYRLQPLRAWRLFVQALACCQEFKFAAQSYNKNLQTVPPEDRWSEAEASIYWTCWKSERELRTELQLPDFKVENLIHPRLFPTPPIDGAESENSGWYFYLAEISLRRLGTRIRDEISRFKPRSGQDFYSELAEAAREFEAQVDGWVQSLPPALHLKDLTSDGVLQFVLRGQLNDCYEIIYWPFVEALVNHRISSSSIDTYASKGLQMHRERLRLNHFGKEYRHHGTWLMLRTCSRSATVLLATIRVPNVRHLMPEGWQDGVLAAIDMLHFWQTEAGDVRDRLIIFQDLFVECQHDS